MSFHSFRGKMSQQTHLWFLEWQSSECVTCLIFGGQVASPQEPMDYAGGWWWRWHWLHLWDPCFCFNFSVFSGKLSSPRCVHSVLWHLPVQFLGLWELKIVDSCYEDIFYSHAVVFAFWFVQKLPGVFLFQIPWLQCFFENPHPARPPSPVPLLLWLLCNSNTCFALIHAKQISDLNRI